jgi:SAM-dependent methyltransferase
MGTRNGREVDLFRIVFYSPWLWLRLIAILESQTPYCHSLIPPFEKYPPRSDYLNLNYSSVVGVEINPHGSRRDILVGSFDELPQEWSGKFGILFSNSFDHSRDPELTAKEWVRVVRPGGILIILWGEADSTETDLVGDISEQNLSNIFKLRKLNINFSKSVCGYNQMVFIKD